MMGMFRPRVDGDQVLAREGKREVVPLDTCVWCIWLFSLNAARMLAARLVATQEKEYVCG